MTAHLHNMREYPKLDWQVDFEISREFKPKDDYMQIMDQWNEEIKKIEKELIK